MLARDMHASRDRLLAALDAHGVARLGDLADLLGWSRPRTGMSLLRARRSSLVCRRQRVYSLSTRGRARLDWWRTRGEA